MASCSVAISLVLQNQRMVRILSIYSTHYTYQYAVQVDSGGWSVLCTNLVLYTSYRYDCTVLEYCTVPAGALSFAGRMCGGGWSVGWSAHAVGGACVFDHWLLALRTVGRCEMGGRTAWLR